MICWWIYGTKDDYSRSGTCLAKNHAKKGDVEKAQQFYAMVLAMFPQNKMAKKELKALQNDAARKSQSSLTQLQKDHLIALYSSGKLKEASSEARLLSQAYPNNPFLQNILGACYAGLGHLNAAVVSYRRALEVMPDFAEVHNNLGVALVDLGQLDTAIASYQLALEIIPDYAEAHNNLGVAFKNLGQLEAAFASYHRALEIKPDYAEAYNNFRAPDLA